MCMYMYIYHQIVWVLKAHIMMVDNAISSWTWGRNVFAWVARSRQSLQPHVACHHVRVCLSCISLVWLGSVFVVFVSGSTIYVLLSPKKDKTVEVM